MTTTEFEKRLSALEEQVADLKSAKKPQNHWWDKIAGKFANNPRFDKAMGLDKWNKPRQTKASASATRTRAKRKAAK